MGRIYVVSSKGLTKIGSSKRPEIRIKAVAREMGFSEYQSFISKDLFIHMDVERKIHSHLSEKIATGKAYKKECFYIDFNSAVNIVARFVEENAAESEVQKNKFSKNMDELNETVFRLINNKSPSDHEKEMSDLYFKCESLIEELELEHIKPLLDSIKSNEVAMLKAYCCLLECLSIEKDAHINDFVSMINQYKEISEKLLKAIK